MDFAAELSKHPQTQRSFHGVKFTYIIFNYRDE
jgi:hypothetical protein